MYLFGCPIWFNCSCLLGKLKQNNSPATILTFSQKSNGHCILSNCSVNNWYNQFKGCYGHFYRLKMKVNFKCEPRYDANVQDITK